MMNKKWILLITLVVLILIVWMVSQHIMQRVETPKYQVMTTSKQIEVRQYEPMIIAEVAVKGNRREAIKKGFRILADYIFGNNKDKTKIPMTAPVQQQWSGDHWTLSFVILSTQSISSLPKPNQEEIKFKQVPQQTFVVVKFSGLNSNENIDENEKILAQYVLDHSIQTIGTPKYAFYNPPWTLPFMRRNEIMLQIPTQPQ